MDQVILAQKAQRLLELHHGPEVLVLPNAWDVTSAALFESMGFQAIATSSAAIAFTHGYADGEYIPRDLMLDAVHRITDKVKLPVTADLEAGYGRDPEKVAETIRLAIEAGAVGANIEDSTKRDPKDAGHQLFELSLGVERIRAAREAADSLGIPFVLNARVDVIFQLGPSPETIAEAILRGNAYAEAGARSIFIIRALDAGTIKLLADGIHAPLNILVGPGTPPIAELKELKVKRVTFGGGLFRVAYSSAVRAAKNVLATGVFDLSEAVVTNQDLNHLFAPPIK